MAASLAMNHSQDQLAAAYVHCQRLARSHYENFPVASVLIPAQLRAAVSAIYTYARKADDIADEGDATTQQRITQLDQIEQQLDDAIEGKQVSDPIIIALADTISQHSLSQSHFHALLSAFRQDAETLSYADEPALLDYCARSANPVGRLMLQLFGQSTPTHDTWSDAICSALQLLNFVQDIGQDIDENGRIYLPEDEMNQCGISRGDIQQRTNSMALEPLIQMQLDRIESLLNRGSALGWQLPGRFGIEIRAITLAAWHLLTVLRPPQDRYSRPRMSRLSLIQIMLKAISPWSAIPRRA